MGGAPPAGGSPNGDVAYMWCRGGGGGRGMCTLDADVRGLNGTSLGRDIAFKGGSGGSPLACVMGDGGEDVTSWSELFPQEPSALLLSSSSSLYTPPSSKKRMHFFLRLQQVKRTRDVRG